MKEMLNSPENWVAKRCANRNILLSRRYGVSGVFGGVFSPALAGSDHGLGRRRLIRIKCNRLVDNSGGPLARQQRDSRSRAIRP